MKAMYAQQGRDSPIRDYPVHHAPKPLFPSPIENKIPQWIAHGEVVLRARAVAVNTHASSGSGNPTLVPLSGTIVAAGSSVADFKRGASVYGLAYSEYGYNVDEFLIAEASGLARKPRNLTWAESAAVAQSGLAAWQALFGQAGIPEPDVDALSAMGFAAVQHNLRGKLLLVPDAASEVGIYLVQLSALVGMHVVAATEDKARNEAFLMAIGASEVKDAAELRDEARFYDFVMSTPGTDLAQAWELVANDGTLVSLDPAAAGFATDSRPAGKENVRAMHSAPKPSSTDLASLSRAVEHEFVRAYVAETVAAEDALDAAQQASPKRRGSIVSTVAHQS